MKPLRLMRELRMCADGPVETYERDPSAELDALLAAAVDGVVTIDENGRILSFNPAAEKLFEYTRGEVLGEPVEILMPEPYRSEHSRYLANFLSTNNPKIIGKGREVQGCKRDGSIFPIWVSVGEVKTRTGRRFVGIISDLTEQREAERKQRSLEARLEHVSRVSLMGEMAAGIAHEINQPLSAIANYAQAGKRLLDNPRPDLRLLSESCDKIAEQAHRAGAVIQNLRNFIRKQDLSKQPVDVNEVIKDVLGLIEADTRAAGLELRLELRQDLPVVKANSVQIQQVVLNLTRNAVDAMRDSLRATTSVGLRTELAKDEQVRILVIDHGPGVSRSLQEEVFHPFVTTKSDGLGVGLAISRTIVEAHGGRLSYRPNPGGGSIFEVALPVDGGQEQ
jgi:two-component system sensor kinase FixL